MKDLPGPVIESARDALKIDVREAPEIGSLRQVLAEQSVRVLVGSALPGARRRTEVDVHLEVCGELLMLGHLPTAVPGQRPPKPGRNIRECGRYRDPDGVRLVSVGKRNDFHEPGAPLDQGGDGGRPLSHHEVAFLTVLVGGFGAVVVCRSPSGGGYG